jgi:hypothetical protein
VSGSWAGTSGCLWADEDSGQSFLRTSCSSSICAGDGW